MKITNSKLLSELKDKEYRDLYIEAHVDGGIPFQLRALRAKRGLSQEALAQLADTKQTVISRIESKGAGNLSVKTLLKLAGALDVALVVRFEPINKFLEHLADLSPEAMSPLASEEILSVMECKAESFTQTVAQPTVTKYPQITPSPSFNKTAVAGATEVRFGA